MRKPGKYLLAGLLALPGASFAAEGLSYTYLEADYLNLDVDAFGDEGDFLDDFDNGSGFLAEGSFAITENWFVFGNWSETDADTGFTNDQDVFIPGNTDVERINLGGGFALPLAERMDFLARAGYTDIDFGDFDFAGSGDTDLDNLDADSTDGWFADAGVRAQILDRLEGSAALRYTDLDTGDDFGVVGNLMFELTPSWGLNLTAEVGDEFASYGAGIRYSFDRFP
jgi:hypothetical protein